MPSVANAVDDRFDDLSDLLCRALGSVVLRPERIRSAKSRNAASTLSSGSNAKASPKSRTALKQLVANLYRQS
jgi:hypothetical protein